MHTVNAGEPTGDPPRIFSLPCVRLVRIDNEQGGRMQTGVSQLVFVGRSMSGWDSVQR